MAEIIPSLCCVDGGYVYQGLIAISVCVLSSRQQVMLYSYVLTCPGIPI